MDIRNIAQIKVSKPVLARLRRISKLQKYQLRKQKLGSFTPRIDNTTIYTEIIILCV